MVPVERELRTSLDPIGSFWIRNKKPAAARNGKTIPLFSSP
jgi:hypothetical protein